MNDDQMKAVAIYATFPDAATARAIGRDLVTDGVAACVNIWPSMRSIYRWNGQVEEADEVVVIMKTQQARVEQLFAEIEQRHPYDTPAIVVLPIAQGSKAYLDWIIAETGG